MNLGRHQEIVQKGSFDILTVKPVLNGHSQKDHKLVFKTNYRLMQVKSIAECSKGSILQYFQPSLSYHLSLRSLVCLFLSGSFTQALLYIYIEEYQSRALCNTLYLSALLIGSFFKLGISIDINSAC